MSHFAKSLLLVLGLFMLCIAPRADAACEYCGGSGGNRHCIEVTDSKPNGNDDCKTGLLGECTWAGTNCKKEGSCTTRIECGPLEDSKLHVPTGSLGEELFREPAPACRLPGIVIEA